MSAEELTEEATKLKVHLETEYASPGVLDVIPGGLGANSLGFRRRRKQAISSHPTSSLCQTSDDVCRFPGVTNPVLCMSTRAGADIGRMRVRSCSRRSASRRLSTSEACFGLLVYWGPSRPASFALPGCLPEACLSRGVADRVAVRTSLANVGLSTWTLGHTCHDKPCHLSSFFDLQVCGCSGQRVCDSRKVYPWQPRGGRREGPRG